MSFEKEFVSEPWIFAMAVSVPAFTVVLAVILLQLLIALFASEGREEGCEGSDFCFSLRVSGNNRSIGSEFAVYGDAEVGDSAVRVTRSGSESSGRIAFRKPIRFFGTNPGFSTSFSFSFSPENGSGLAFFLSPAGVPLEPEEGKWLGLSTSLVAVKIVGSVIEIDVGGEILTRSGNLSGVAWVLRSGERLRSWIDYDGESKRTEVRVSRDEDSRPINSSISCSMDFSNILWGEPLLAGLGSWGANSTEASSIYSWNFTVKYGEPYLMHSEPLNPNALPARPTEGSHERRRAYPWRLLTALLFAAACGAALTFFMVLFVWVALASRWPVAPAEYPVLPAGVAYGKIDSVGKKELEVGQK